MFSMPVMRTVWRRESPHSTHYKHTKHTKHTVRITWLYEKVRELV
jgi:hypothetical protein